MQPALRQAQNHLDSKRPDQEFVLGKIKEAVELLYNLAILANQELQYQFGEYKEILATRRKKPNTPLKKNRKGANEKNPRHSLMYLDCLLDINSADICRWKIHRKHIRRIRGESQRDQQKVEVFNKDVKEFEQRNKRLFRSSIKRQREGKELERRHKELERMQKEIKEEFVKENLLLIAILRTIEKHTRWEKEESND